jgi:hypothetical protein
MERGRATPPSLDLTRDVAHFVRIVGTRRLKTVENRTKHSCLFDSRTGDPGQQPLPLVSATPCRFPARDEAVLPTIVPCDNIGRIWAHVVATLVPCLALDAEEGIEGLPRISFDVKNKTGLPCWSTDGDRGRRTLFQSKPRRCGDTHSTHLTTRP